MNQWKCLVTRLNIIAPWLKHPGFITLTPLSPRHIGFCHDDRFRNGDLFTKTLFVDLLISAATFSDVNILFFVKSLDHACRSLSVNAHFRLRLWLSDTASSVLVYVEIILCTLPSIQLKHPSSWLQKHRSYRLQWFEKLITLFSLY